MAKGVVRQILLIYLSTTGIFLAIFFSLWYGKLYEGLVLSKGAILRDWHRNILINVLNARFTPLDESAKNIAQSSGLKFAIFDANKLWFDNLDFDRSKAKFRGMGIADGRVFFLAPMSFEGYFLGRGGERFSNDEGLKILLQGEDVAKDLLAIRAKVVLCALLAFALLAFIAFVLVKIALRPLEDKIRLLDRFIKDSTHEINTPLSVILMSVEQLERKKTQDEKFERIKLAAKTLHQIYSDLVFYNFSHTLENEKSRLKMKDLIAERLEYFSPFLAQKELRLERNLSEEAFIFANKNAITRLFDNLLSNAIKYNKKGGKIDICLQKNRLQISDSGCGIAGENLSRIFERYARFDASQGGFGIGLSLVKKICLENGIKITCDSRENEGSTFVLEWELFA
ncbi:HAMP domain-containing sensor histidine kinase [Campylobacter sp.]|uniref:sensor histidine kinase n=1 Tax=Campylobacter sp. TaxID=205 RepID=UPI0026DCC354|nr:HAMP domain-containing sensor histidine kinase [Campylobacter sp.]MDO4674109.1 HAMP domain-containing sensor histidine kinase [Campylobacter sp.]